MRMRFGAALIITAVISVSAVQAKADTNIKLIVDGRLINMDIQPKIINGRVMAPVRVISENIGASVGWEDDLKQISVYSHNRYVIMRIGDSNMRYGTFSADATGSFFYDTQMVYVLESPPVITRDRTLVPLRAIAEGLGAGVSWDPETFTVYISSYEKSAPPQLASPTPTPAPQSDSRYFREISAAQAQRWYDTGAPYILFYYSHLSESSMAVLKWAQQAAARQNLIVYGVDTDSSIYNNTGGVLTFIWRYINQGSENTKPSFFFVGRTGNVTPLIQPRDINSIDFCMTAFYYSASRGNTTVSGNDLPQRLPDMPSIDISAYWRDITKEQAISKYNNNDRFIYICYNSRNAECNSLLPMLWLAVERTQTVIYATDFAYINEDRNWFGKDALNGRDVYAFPTIFFVAGRDYIPYGSVQPRNILEIMNAFSNFSRTGR